MGKSISDNQPPIYLAEIRVFAGNFAPKNWMFCFGQELPVSDYMELYSVIGNIYGGNHTLSFRLPDLRSRCSIAMGTGPGLSTRQIATYGGSEEVSLQFHEMPEHTHTVISEKEFQANGQISGGAKAKLLVSSENGDEVNPKDNFPGLDNSFAGKYSEYADASACLNSNAISLSGKINVNVTGVKTSVEVNKTGDNLSHQNMAPFLGLNYIICVNGAYPSRQ